MNVLITCGLRRGECIGLQWRDIDPDKLTLSISRNVTMDKNSPDKIRVGSTKTGESRTVPLSPRVYGLLMELKREQEERLQMKIMPACFIFSRQADPQKPIYPTEPTRFMRKFIGRHNLPDVSPHDLRHPYVKLKTKNLRKDFFGISCRISHPSFDKGNKAVETRSFSEKCVTLQIQERIPYYFRHSELSANTLRFPLSS